MIFDLHNDFSTVLDKAGYEKYFKQNRDTVITAAIWTSEFGNDATEKAEKIACDLRAARFRRLAVEDAGFLAERDAYRKFDFDALLYCSLTWNYNNAFAGGALDDGYLTDKGKQMIDYINHSSCVLDTAHLNKKSFYKAVECADRVICSHTGFNNHLRSLDDSQIKLLIERGGIIGLCTVVKFTDAQNSEEFSAVIDRFVQKYGINHLALGTDFYGSSDIPSSINDYRKLEGIRYYLHGFGYSDNDCNKILYSNAQDFFE